MGGTSINNKKQTNYLKKIKYSITAPTWNPLNQIKPVNEGGYYANWIKISEIISSPVSQQFFTRNNDENLIISCRYDWFLENLVKKINLRKDEEDI